MAFITEKDRLDEFENLKELLDELEVAAEIIPAGPVVEQSCLMIALPTNIEDWEQEYKTDLHMAAAYLIQIGDDEEQLTKYMMIYMPVQVDLTGVDELAVLKLINEANKEISFGTCFYAEEQNSKRMLLQVKCLIGGAVDEYLDEGVVCEVIYDLGVIYDMLKERLLKLKETA